MRSTQIVVQARYDVALSRLHAAARPRILIVDDNLASLAGLRAMLAEVGEVAVQADPVLALEHVAERHADLIVLDLAMPAMHGYEFAAALNGIDPDVPVLAVSGTDTAPDLRALNGAGRKVAFMAKPPLAREFRALARRMLDAGLDTPR